MPLAIVLNFSFLLSCVLSATCFPSTDDRAQALKSRAERIYQSLRRTAFARCSNEPQAGPSSPRLIRDVNLGSELDSMEPGRGRRAIATGDVGSSRGTAILVSSSRGLLTVDEQHIPDHVFTVALWCKPEGGQSSPAIILEAIDACLPFPDRGWSLGIQSSESSGERDLRVFFWLHTWSKPTGSHLTSPIPVVPGKWIHIAAVYDGRKMELYLDGARISLSDGQSGHPLGAPTCRSVFLGGSDDQHYRGRLDDFRLWSSALSHNEIKAAMSLQPLEQRPSVEDDFESLDLWDWGLRNHISDQINLAPVLVPSDMSSSSPHAPQPKPNPCGLTICDAPDITRSYKDHWILRKNKVLRYRVVVVSNDDELDPTVTEEQVDSQHDFLHKAFSPYNITWELEKVIVRNSSLRGRSVLLSCDSSMVGNGFCEPECHHPSTGNDGGDCGSVSFSTDSCQEEMLDNGICDSVCNVRSFDWDRGDCCSPGSTVCYDPNSPNRSYMDVQELKSLVQLKNLDAINVLFALWTDRDILGVATFPWEKNVFSEQGGIVLQPSQYGKERGMSTLIHELGHALGLWHVHRGVSELVCRHPCYEKEASSISGDLCSDTAPTPANNQCKDPPFGENICGKSRFSGTPYTNYMGYGDDSCVSEFSAEQVARMHCYIDLVYMAAQRRNVNELSAPPLPPKVISSTSTSLTLSWISPLASGSFYDTNICSFCSEKLEYSQYGYWAESAASADYMPAGAWAPQQATGVPDAETCVISYKAWLPDAESCPDEICTLTVHFEHPAAASSLIIWVTWNAFNGLDSVEVVFEDGNTDSIRNLHPQCDSPLTIPLFYKQPITKIHIHTRNSYVGIDAVKLTSIPNNPLCTPCKPFRYRVIRNPPFPEGESKDLDDTLFTDRNLQSNEKYEYKVQAWLGSRVSEFSPTLTHVTGSPVCGNGVIDSAEECDDGDMMDGNGCSSSCSVEEFYHCTGEPSLCIWHEGDGMCQDFERPVSIADCGFFTPQGYTDQWAETVTVGPEDLASSCPATAVIGPPSLPVGCKDELNISTSWYACDTESEVWIAATFPEPVVATSVQLYLASDGVFTGLGGWSSQATLRLLNSEGSSHHKQDFDISCSTNPQEIPITWDLSIPLKRTWAINLSFTSPEIAISAIRLRSSNVINPMALEDCTLGKLYHPGLRKCDSFCHLPPCPTLLAKHAHLTCTGRNEGDTCTVTCEPGHSRQDGSQPVICMAGEWRGSDPNCKPVDCGLPLLAHADAVCPDGTTFAKSCSYKCRPPARFLGGANGFPTIQCESNGLWSQPQVLCQVTCPPPSPPAHTVLASPRCRNAETFVFGQRCRFRCKRGYHVENFGLRKRVLHLQCDITASWSGPQCVPITCPSLNIPSYECTAGYSAGSACTVTCSTLSKDMVRSVHRCEFDGTWSPSIPKCHIPASCSTPVTQHPGVKFLCEGNYVGATCKVTCTDTANQVVSSSGNEKSAKFQCLENGQWSHDVQDFVCKITCIEIFLSDGFCDAKNNQEHCRWDGGDCCTSTVLGGTVKPFPANCGDPCSCADPQAQENLNIPP